MNAENVKLLDLLRIVRNTRRSIFYGGKGLTVWRNSVEYRLTEDGNAVEWTEVDTSYHGSAHYERRIGTQGDADGLRNDILKDLREIAWQNFQAEETDSRLHAMLAEAL